MEWDYLEKLWQRAVRPSETQPEASDSWDREIATLYSLGIGMEKTLRFLYHESPSLDAFKTWITEQQVPQDEPVQSMEQDVLTKEDLAFWDEHGFIVLKQAIPPEDCRETVEAIWNFLGMDPSRKDTWYQAHDDLRGMMLTFTDHATLQRNRQSPLIRKAFEQLYNRTDLYKSIDKVSFNLPENEWHVFNGSPLHWDVSLKQPIPMVLQGLLYLTDCEAKDGAFQCVPGFHKCIGEWLQSLSPGENPRELAPWVLKPISVEGKAGDFVIWHSALPHGATPNHGASPRIVQYLKYTPVDYKVSEEWI